MPRTAKTINETKDVIAFGITLFSVIGSALDDGKISLRDATKAFVLFGPIKAALEGAKEIPAELLDIDEAEMDELCAMIGGQLNISITGKVARETANKVLNTLRSVVDLQAHMRGVNPPKAEIVKKEEG